MLRSPALPLRLLDSFLVLTLVDLARWFVAMIHLNTLPSEVLAHIFELGTASPEIDFGQENCSAPVSLICNSWRTLALDTPTPWTSLTMDSNESPPFTKTRTYIVRSKGTPINIS
ncbi:hypothetical protein RSAG8_12710, partial [Rhizoctonia solani AG-8 WAC10335]